VARTQHTLKLPDPAIAPASPALVEAGMVEHPRAAAAASTTGRRTQVTAANQADLVELTEMERELEQLRSKLVYHLDRISSLLGVGALNPHVHTIEQESLAHHRWHETTALFQMPYHLTPAYWLHLEEHQASLRQTRAPPNAHQFTHLVPDDNDVPAVVLEEEDGDVPATTLPRR
jgi:hypothetical protein